MREQAQEPIQETFEPMNALRRSCAASFIAIMAVGAGWKIIKRFKQPTSTHVEGPSMTLRLPMVDLKPIFTFDPAKIRLLDDYNLFENLYSTLFEYAPDGKLVSGLVSELNWLDGKAHLKIRTDLKTKDGRTVTADDVFFSLKRVLVLSSNTHGRLADILCPGQKIVSIDSPCDGIVLKGDDLILAPQSQRAFLLPMLSSADFSILLRSTVDSKTLKIADYANTTGPYYVSQDLSEGVLKLSSNKNHWRYKDSMPQNIEIHGIDPKNSLLGLQLFESGKLNYLPKWYGSISKKQKMSELLGPQISTSKSWPFSVRLVRFTEKGLRWPPERKLKLVNIIRHAYREAALKASIEFHPAYQFLQPYGDGALSDEQLTEIERMHQSLPISQVESFSGVRIGIFAGAEDTLKSVIGSALPGLEVLAYDDLIENIRAGSKAGDEPDAYIEVMDSAGNEDISSITFTMNSGYFLSGKKEQEEWLAKYVMIESKDDRLNLLRSLHFEALKTMRINPLLAESYVSIARDGWKIEQPERYATDAFWMITKQ